MLANFTWTALVTLGVLVLQIVILMRVGGARYKYKVEAPATTGDPMFERHFRVQMNTLEWLPIFLPALWLAAASWSDTIAAGIGAAWILGRVIYMVTYVANPKSRSVGFLVQGIATLVLIGGALVSIVMPMIK